MRRMHVIEDFDRMGGEIYYREDKYAHDPELLEAYRCGKKDGWREAMQESERYRERKYDRDGIIKYRHDDEDCDDEDMYDERRRRSRRTGRFI